MSDIGVRESVGAAPQSSVEVVALAQSLWGTQPCSESAVFPRQCEFQREEFELASSPWNRFIRQCVCCSNEI